MATQTMIPLQSFFVDLEARRDMALEPVTKRQKVEGDKEKTDSMNEEQLLMRIHYNKLAGPTEVTLSPIALYNSKTEKAADSLQTLVDPQALRSQLQHNLHQWERLHQREEQLIQQAKQYLANFEIPQSSESPSILQHHHKFLASEINSFMEHRTTTLGALLEASSLVNSEKQESIQPVPQQPRLLIAQQPAKTAVVNRYISPSPSVEVSNLERGSSLAVCVSLLHHDSEEGVQDILQGTKRISLDASGKASFSKLKITEISPRHRQQPFSLLFTLEDYTSGEMKVVATAKTDSFLIQSRPTNRTSKRRREDDDSKYYGSTSSDEDYVQNSPRERPHTEQPEPKSGGLVLPEYNYVDITEYLTLPQKEAATRLGISESMLCKRFKECTRRKWPYRYIRKIDKVINMLCAHQDGQPLSPEDKKKLEKLVKEREERLQPVKIRITAHDRTPSAAPVERSRSPSPSPMDSSPDSANFNDEEQFVLETLEMLKTQRSPKDQN